MLAPNITQYEYDVTKQVYREIYAKIKLLDYQFNVIDEWNNVVIGQPSFSIDANSDIRRTCNLSLYPKDKSFDIAYGNKIWLDKYVQVYIGIKHQHTKNIIYSNMGIYVVNNPSRVYSATDNTLTINGLDLMCKLTGLRGGNLKTPYKIKQNTNVRNQIIAILRHNGFYKYKVDECPYTVPTDLEFNATESWYNVLSKLNEIIPNYQMYFDTKGVFHYEPIMDNITAGENPDILVDDDIWDKTLISYNINTDFESVKNSINVYGKTWEVKYHDYATRDDDVYSVSLENLTHLYNQVTLGFTTPKNTYKGDISYLKVSLSPSTISALKESYENALKQSNDMIAEMGVNGNVSLSERPIIKGSVLLNGGYVNDLKEDDDVSLYPLLYELNQNGTTMVTHITPIMADGTLLNTQELQAYINENLNNKPNILSSDYRHLVINCVEETEPITEDYYDVLSDKLDLQQRYYRDYVEQYNKYRQAGIEPKAYKIMGEDGTYPKLARSTYYVVRFMQDTNDDNNSYYKFLGELNPSGSAQETNPKSPFYVNGTMGEVTISLSGGEYDNIFTSDLATQRARYELYKRCRLQDNITLTCVPIYWLDVNWIIEITLPNKQGVYNKNKYIIKSISTQYGTNATQTITAMKYYAYYK